MAQCLLEAGPCLCSIECSRGDHLVLRLASTVRGPSASTSPSPPQCRCRCPCSKRETMVFSTPLPPPGLPFISLGCIFYKSLRVQLQGGALVLSFATHPHTQVCLAAVRYYCVEPLHLPHQAASAGLVASHTQSFRTRTFQRPSIAR